MFKRNKIFQPSEATKELQKIIKSCQRDQQLMQWSSVFETAFFQQLTSIITSFAFEIKSEELKNIFDTQSFRTVIFAIAEMTIYQNNYVHSPFQTLIPDLNECLNCRYFTKLDSECNKTIAYADQIIESLTIAIVNWLGEQELLVFWKSLIQECVALIIVHCETEYPKKAYFFQNKKVIDSEKCTRFISTQLMIFEQIRNCFQHYYQKQLNNFVSILNRVIQRVV